MSFNANLHLFLAFFLFELRLFNFSLLISNLKVEYILDLVLYLSKFEIKIQIQSSFCAIEEGRSDPFYDMNRICMNGRHHVDYYMSYLKDYEDKLRQMKVPYIHYVQTNIAHEESGFRIQANHFIFALLFKCCSNSTEKSSLQLCVFFG